MKGINRGFWIAACTLALSGPVHAAMIMAGPTATISNPTPHDTFCQVLNTSTRPVTVTIRARNEMGLTEEQSIVTLQPEQGTSLFGGSNVSVCTFDGPGKRKMRGMLIHVDAATGHYAGASVAQ